MNGLFHNSKSMYDSLKYRVGHKFEGAIWNYVHLQLTLEGVIIGEWKANI